MEAVPKLLEFLKGGNTIESWQSLDGGQANTVY
jgi:hypothetical protein